jgi:hypothetical protein
MHLKHTAGCQISTLIFEKTPLYNLFSNIKVDIWHPAMGLRCIIPSRHLSQLKTRAVPFNVSPKWERTLIARVFNWLKCLGGIMHLKHTAGCQISTLIFEKKLWRGGSLKISHTQYIKNDIFFMGYFDRDPPLQFVFKYQSWYLTPCYGLEVHYTI